MRSHSQSDHALSPVIATVLLVAITVAVVAITSAVVMGIAGGYGGEKSVDIAVSPIGEGQFDVIVTGGPDTETLELLEGYIDGVIFEHNGVIDNPVVGLPCCLNISGSSKSGEKLLTLIGGFTDGTLQVVYQSPVNIQKGGVIPPVVVPTFTPKPTVETPTPVETESTPTHTIPPTPPTPVGGESDFHHDDTFKFGNLNLLNYGIIQYPSGAVSRDQIVGTAGGLNVLAKFKAQAANYKAARLTVMIYDDNNVNIYTNSTPSLMSGNKPVISMQVDSAKIQSGYTIRVILERWKEIPADITIDKNPTARTTVDIKIE